MTKATNPKDALGTGRLPMSLVPSSGIAAVTLAFLEGACKYGRFNWRASPVRASIYADAMHRHLAKWFNGEDCDEKTNVPHLASIIASAMILIDAELCGTLNDDRPPVRSHGSHGRRHGRQHRAYQRNLQGVFTPPIHDCG